jgi:hypothetical protein
MTINEIKENLGIDLKIKSRKPVYSILKAMYVEQQYKELKHLKATQIPKIICIDINCDRTNIYNYIKKLTGYKLDIASKLIVKAYLTKDKKYIDEYYNYLKKQTDNYRKQKTIDNFCKELDNKKKYSKPFISTKPKVNRPMNNLQVADYLKANKIFKYCKFWDKTLNKFTEEDWNELREINPTMFDTYLK